MNAANFNLTVEGEKISDSLEYNLKLINEIFYECPDIKRKEVYLKDRTRGYFIYVDEIINLDLVERDFMTPLLGMSITDFTNEKKAFNLPSASLSIFYDIKDVISNILVGNTVFILDGIEYAISCNIIQFNKREITEPISEKNVKGPHEGFVEVLNTNLSILRRRIRNNRLKFKMCTLGTISNQSVAIAYIEGVANPELLNTLYNKVSSIDYDGLIAIGYIEQLIMDFKYSPFPQYMATERPDRVEAALLEGKFGILLNGTPVALVTPVNFFSFFQAEDDFATNWISGSFLRIIRFFSALVAIFLPALYIAVTSFHYYMVPLNILITLAQSRARVPIPPILEALFMEIMIEMLREAAIRLPTYVGTAISVVGGIILGQATVEANIVSSLLIITVAATAIASYVVPNNDMGFAIRITRFIYMIAASIFGMIGIVVCSAMLLAHLVVLESLGQPYFEPFIPLKINDLKDSVIRMPFNILRKRPGTAKPIDSKRGKNHGKRT